MILYLCVVKYTVYDYYKYYVISIESHKEWYRIEYYFIS